MPSSPIIADDAFTHESRSLAVASIDRGRPKHWMALCLIGTVYVFGISGLWSDYQSFDTATHVIITPSGHGDTVAPITPIEEEIDLRDALLDGPFRPKFRPQVEELADSGLQQPI
jgi:hypothetical protein